MSYLAFIDESGDHNLDISRLDNQSNVFVLGAVLFEEKDYAKFDVKFRQLKKSLFGQDDIIIHTKEITRPASSKDKRNLQFLKPAFRKQFYTSINELINKTRFKIVACVIRKHLLLAKYGEHADDPYLFSFDNLLNRLMFQVKGELRIFPEMRRGPEDNRLEIAFLNAKLGGTKFFKGSEVKERVAEFKIIDKKINSSGLQLADLIVTPIGRHLLGKDPRPGNEVLYSVVKEKIPARCFTVFP